MIKVLRNTSGRNTPPIRVVIYGKPYVIAPKKTISIDHEGGDKHPADILLEKYGFLRDITKVPDYKPTEPKMAEGKPRE